MLQETTALRELDIHVIEILKRPAHDFLVTARLRALGKHELEIFGALGRLAESRLIRRHHGGFLSLTGLGRRALKAR